MLTFCLLGILKFMTWYNSSILKRSPGSGRLDCAKKHKDALTPGSRIRDLPDCAEKLEGSRLGMSHDQQ